MNFIYLFIFAKRSIYSLALKRCSEITSVGSTEENKKYMNVNSLRCDVKTAIAPVINFNNHI